MWQSIPGTLRAFDAKRYAQVPEPLAVQLLWVVLLTLPQVRTELGLPNVRWWRLGGHGVGDLQALGGVDGESGRLAHVEVKSETAAFSYGVRCAYGCTGEAKNQLFHMSHDDVPIVLVAQSHRHAYLRKGVEALGLEHLVDYVSYAEVGDAVERALVEYGDIDDDLLAMLFDVSAEAASLTACASGAVLGMGADAVGAEREATDAPREAA